MDIRTRGAQEGLMISTGVLAGSSGANYSAGAQNGCWPTWPTLALDANNAMRNEIITPQPFLEDNAKDQNAILTVPSPILRTDSSTPKEWLQLQPQLQLQSKPELPKQHESAWTNNPNNNDLKELEGAQLRHSSNIEGRHFFDNNNRNLESNLKPMGNPNPGRSLGAAAFQHSSNDPTIRLNLFEGSEEPLVPLQAPPGVRGSGDGGLLTQFEFGAGFPPATTSAAAATPLLCDSTTTTTTLEVFRPRADSADFFQLPRGPLSHSKEPVLIVPAKGAEFERREKSETRFSDTIRRMEFASQIPHQQKSVQWGDPVSIQPSLSPSSSTPNSQFDSPLLFSPPQQTPTPNTSITSPLPIVTSPSSKDDLNLSSEEYLTILRHQKQENSERTLISPPSAPETGECPPRPPKRQKGRRGDGVGDGDEYALPPRPPKPAHLRKPRNARERSQSADPLSRLLFVPADQLGMPTDRPTVGRGTRPAVGGGGGGPLRSASSNEIFKLYQTRDCLGRVVCEW